MNSTVASTPKTTLSGEEKFRKSALLVFFCGALLRVVLAMVNLQANDNHIEVIITIADENRIPAKEEMWEAFQPQFYHMIVALLWKILPTPALPSRIRMAQMISCTAGILTLLLALRFLRHHRTSLWSQLYGRAHFAHFDDWPPSWRLSTLTWQWTRNLVRNLGRLIFLCAIFPTLLLVMAFWKQVVSTIRWLGNARQSQVRLGDWLLNLAAFSYMAFIVAYSLRYRDYAVMKAIFILPGLLGLLMLFARECDAFYRRFTDQKAVRLSADIILFSLLVFYTVDILVLIGQLGIQW